LGEIRSFVSCVARLQLGDDHCMETFVGIAAERSRQAFALVPVRSASNRAADLPGICTGLFRELARKSESEPQRAMYLKAAQTWLDAATRFEFETGHYISGRAQPAA
jgi:hypothetical protein